MGNGFRWQLVVDTPDGFTMQLPLEQGLYRVGRERGADFALGSLAGTISVTADGVKATLQDKAIDITQVAQTLDGLKLRVELEGKSARQTQSMPTKRTKAHPLTLSDPKGRTQPRTFMRGEARIGADESCDLRPRSEFLSQFHCTLYERDGRWFVRDLGSKNGTFLNELRVNEAEIVVPALLRVGDVTWKLDNPEAAEQPRYRHQMLGNSAAIRDVIAKIEKFAPSRASVLILGESGTGKELVARATHDRSARHARAFVTINCGAMAANLIDSELFGHARGSFTGAMDKRNGAFISADEGTLFLDEVGELPLELQPKLLRVLETMQVKTVGEDKARQVNVRVITATHRDLRAAVKRGQFREDLYHRLSVLTLDVPPLRERASDIEVLSQHFVNEMSTDEKPLRLSSDALAALRAHRFPGNVRELRNALVRAALLQRGGVMTAADLGLVDEEELHQQPIETHASLEGAERATIVRAMQQAKGSRMSAARALGIARSTLYRKIEEYRILDHEWKASGD